MANKEKRKEHWLDFAEDRFDRTLIEETKALLQVMFLYLPLPVFWALFDQQGSRWTFQATNMDGTLGWYTLKPEQLQVMNPLLILIFIPLFESVLYPILGRCKILTRPLQKLSAGGILAAVAFFISALVELRLQALGSYAVVPHMGESQLRIFNGLNCSVYLESAVDAQNKLLQLQAEVGTLQAFQSLHLPASSLTVTATANSSQCPGLLPWTGNISTVDAKAVSYFIMKNDDEDYFPGNIVVEKIPGFDNVQKSEIGNPRLRVLYKLSADRGNLKFKDDEESATVVLTKSDIYTPQKEMPGLVGSYRIYIGGTEVQVGEEDEIEMGSGGVYTLVIHENKTHISGNLVTVSPPNKVHMLWLFPQYAVMTIAEIMFVVSGIEFSFTQAPGSMKAVLSASWLLTVAFGNLIVVIISTAKFFKNLADEFFLFVVLMLIDMTVFITLASKYHYVPTTPTELNLQKLG